MNVNKHNTKYEKASNLEEAKGSKWSLSSLKKWMTENNINFNAIWAKIKDLIIKTCIAVEPFMLNSVNKTQ